LRRRLRRILLLLDIGQFLLQSLNDRIHLLQLLRRLRHPDIAWIDLSTGCRDILRLELFLASLWRQGWLVVPHGHASEDESKKNRRQRSQHQILLRLGRETPDTLSKADLRSGIHSAFSDTT
jgi:hypothetical protein